MISIRYTAAAMQDPILLAKLDKLVMPIAIATAHHIKRRMLRGESATPFAGYDTTKRSYRISEAYGDKIGSQKLRYDNAAELHREINTVNGSFNVSGGMWQGLQVRNSGNAAVIDFQGSSLGGLSLRTALKKRDKDGNVQYRTKPTLVRNSVKAGTVFKNSRIGVLQPTPGETQAQAAAVMYRAGDILRKMFGSTGFDSQFEGDRALFQAIIRGS